MVALAKFFDWRDALAIVKPEAFVGLATDGVQDVLAMEVAQTRPSGTTEEPPRTDWPDGSRKPNVG
jgi:hypothetical protein